MPSLKRPLLSLMASAPLWTGSAAVHAMTMLRQGDTMVLAGPVVPDDAGQFRKKLAEGPLKRVILLSSHGGKTLEGTRLGFHAPHTHVVKALSARGAVRLEDWLLQRSGGKFNGELLARVINISRPNDMLFFYYPGSADANGQPSVMFCNEGVRLRSLCEKFPGANALAAGVLTTGALFPPDTPIYATVVAQQPQTAASAAETQEAAASNGQK
jgi:hypothetical protein